MKPLSLFRAGLCVLLLFAATSVLASEARLSGGAPLDSSIPTGRRAEAAAQIEAKETASVGELIRLRATGGDATAYSWVVVPPTEDFETLGDRAFLSARSPGQFTVVLAVATADGVEQVTHVITVGEGPAPDPFPTPHPTKQLQVLIVEESADRTPSQAKVILGQTWREWLKNNGHPKPRLADKDLVSTDLAPWIERAGPQLPTIFLIDGADASLVYEGKMPETEAAMLELVNRFGAKQ
jgi:hypothetical protein